MSFQIRPKLRTGLPQLLAGLAVFIAAASAPQAQTRTDELNTPAAASQTRGPARGMSMEKVEATFGAPTSRVPAVGEPPISRWEYPGFVVYFENQLVIHTVAIG
ncbi:MAG: hypothetical protein SXG53_14415 [Pseudomonadota bacterium]|nr:hypothetical protein [Pseudomonadota bacterium]